ncbi:hypothetical protein LWI29_000496 [Acer saccharum]|uniref:HAT C-terminal dimerisation domain-containing protein n=1 Tax=Acer saccharum TaxID=4024 RepID=A0AA39VHC4_ACESA|nr:hypothetical protein LWI29_000496 [Acer saccharum]
MLLNSCGIVGYQTVGSLPASGSIPSQPKACATNCGKGAKLTKKQWITASLLSPSFKISLRVLNTYVLRYSCLMLSSATVKMLLSRMDSGEYLLDQRQKNWTDELKNENELWIGDSSGYDQVAADHMGSEKEEVMFASIPGEIVMLQQEEEANGLTDNGIEKENNKCKELVGKVCEMVVEEKLISDDSYIGPCLTSPEVGQHTDFKVLETHVISPSFEPTPSSGPAITSVKLGPPINNISYVKPVNGMEDSAGEVLASVNPKLSSPIASESCESPSREEDVAEIDEAIHSTEFWTRCKKVVQVLRSLFRYLEFIDDYVSTFGYLYEASNRTEEAIKQLCDSDDQTNCEMIFKPFKDWKRRAIKPVHAAAAFLNPAYFCSENFTEDTDEMQEGLQHLKLLVPPEEREALSEQLKLYSERMHDSFFITAMKMLNTINPRTWWESYGDCCPILRKLAVRILSQPCSTPLFPKLVNFQLDDEDDEVRMNTILMENFKPQNSEPIHLTSEDPDYAYEDVLHLLDEGYDDDEVV